MRPSPAPRPRAPAAPRPGCGSARAALLLALVGAGCGDADVEVRLELPIAEVHRAVIVVAWPQGRPDAAVAYARAVRPDQTIAPLSLPFRRAAGVELAAALYSASLDELFVSEGTVTLEPGDPGRPVPSTAEVYAASVRAEGDDGWRRVQTPPDGLAAARLPAVDDCPSLTPAAYEIAGARSPYFALGVRVESPPEGWTGRGVLLGDQDRRLYYVEGDHVRELEPPPPGAACGNDPLDRALYYGGYQAPDGAVWLAGRCGELHRGRIDLAGGRLDGGLARAMFARDTARAVAGPREGPVTTLHAQSEVGEVDRLDAGGGATLLAAEGREGEGGLVHLSDDEAVFVWTPRPEVVRLRGASIEREALPVTDGSGVELRRIGLTEQLGLVVGASDGRAYYARSGTWRPLGTPRGGAIRDLRPHRGSVAVLDAAGELHLFAPARGAWCPSTPLEDRAGLGLRLLAVTEGAMLATGAAGSYVWVDAR